MRETKLFNIEWFNADSMCIASKVTGEQQIYLVEPINLDDFETVKRTKPGLCFIDESTQTPYLVDKIVELWEVEAILKDVERMKTYTIDYTISVDENRKCKIVALDEEDAYTKFMGNMELDSRENVLNDRNNYTEKSNPRKLAQFKINLSEGR